MMNFLRAFLGGLFVVGLFLPNAVKASTQKFSIESGSGKVEFNATGRPSMLKIHGLGSALEIRFQSDGATLSGSASFDLESLDTGIGLRNQHMKSKYLETEKYRRAALSIESLNLPRSLGSEALDVGDVPFLGKLSLHGVEKAVQGRVALRKSAGQVEVNARFNLKIADFSIPTPGFAGITMADDVEVLVQFQGRVVPSQ